MRESILDFTGMIDQHCFLIGFSGYFSSLTEDLKSMEIFMRCTDVSNEHMHAV